MPIRNVRVLGAPEALDDLLQLARTYRTGRRKGVRGAATVIRDAAKELAPRSQPRRRRRRGAGRRRQAPLAGHGIRRRRGALRRSIRRAGPSRNQEIAKAQRRLHAVVQSRRVASLIYPLVFYALWQEEGAATRTRRRRTRRPGKTWRGHAGRRFLRTAANRSSNRAVAAFRDIFAAELRPLLQARGAGRR